MFEGKRVAVVIPAFHEERRIAATLSSVPAIVDEVIVVDDASTDATSVVVREHSLDVHLLLHRENRGVGAAIVTGLRHAVAMGVDVVAVMAGDGQMDPSDLPRLLRPIVSGRADFVKGDRFAHPDRARSMPIQRYLAGRLLAELTRVAAGLPELSDSQTGYVAFSRATLLALDLEALWPRYGYPNDLLGMLAELGARIDSVVVRPVYRGEASGLRPWHLLTVLSVIARVASRRLSGSLQRDAGAGAADAAFAPDSRRTRSISSAWRFSASPTRSIASSAARRTGRLGTQLLGPVDVPRQT